MDTINFVEMLIERVKENGLLGVNHSDDERERDVIAMIEDCYATFEAIKREVANDKMIICNNFCLDSNTSTTTKPHGCWCCMFRHTCRE